MRKKQPKPYQRITDKYPDGEPQDNKYVADLVTHHQAKLSEHRELFRRIFGRELTSFMHPFLGFDVITFDEFIKTPDGTSTKAWLLEKFGQEGHDIIFSIIKPREKGGQREMD